MTIRWENVLLLVTVFYGSTSGLFLLKQRLMHHYYTTTPGQTWCMVLDANNQPHYRYGKEQCGL
ncbi:MAG: hypothetical protein VKL39_16880 [Leptolyngbyaceae bacterium]|nr:hypothetical protein [Leptolyngbyaceae bacterium]